MDAKEKVLRSIYAAALDKASEPEAIVVLALDDEAVWLAFGAQSRPTQVVPLPLGLSTLAARFFGGGTFSELAIEQAIAEVEERVMPWQRQLPSPARLFTADADIVDIARWAGMPEEGRTWRLSTDSVERLFNRWIARAQGRPASRDALPLTARFSASLLVLRECLHHLGFDGVTLLRDLPISTAGAA